MTVMVKSLIMKKTFLLLGILIAFFGAEAQTSKKQKKSKKTKVSSEALMQARMDSLEAQRQVRIDSTIALQLQSDSIRRFNDSMANEKYQQERLAWNEAKNREIDSLNKEHAKTLSREQEQALAIQQSRNEASKAAKLNDYQKQQVNFILQAFYTKAIRIKQDSSVAEDQKKQQLAQLNDERRSKLRSVIGKSKERKLEKARKSQNNTIDTEVQWINEAEGYAKN